MRHVVGANLSSRAEGSNQSIQDLFNQKLGIETSSFSGDYRDLTGDIPNVPNLPQVPVNSSQNKHYLLQVQGNIQQPGFWQNAEIFSPSDRQKLARIETGATVNTQSDWNETNSRSISYIHNKPQRIIATRVKSDWNQPNSADASFIRNKWSDRFVGEQAWRNFPINLPSQTKNSIKNSIDLNPTNVVSKVWNFVSNPSATALNNSKRAKLRDQIVRPEIVRTVVPLPHETVRLKSGANQSFFKLQIYNGKYYVLEENTTDFINHFTIKVYNSAGELQPDETLAITGVAANSFQIYNSKLYVLSRNQGSLTAWRINESNGSYSLEANPVTIPLGGRLSLGGNYLVRRFLDFHIVDSSTVYVLLKATVSSIPRQIVCRTYLTTLGSGSIISDFVAPGERTLNFLYTFVSGAFLSDNNNFEGNYVTQDLHGLSFWNQQDSRLLTFPMDQGQNIYNVNDRRYNFVAKGVTYDPVTKKIYYVVHDETYLNLRKSSVRVLQIRDVAILK